MGTQRSAGELVILSLGRTRTSTEKAAEFSPFRFTSRVLPFLIIICTTHAFLFLFCVKVCEYEKLEALFVKRYED